MLLQNLLLFVIPALLCEVSEAVLYLVAPEEAWKCHAEKVLLVELLSSVVLRPLLALLSDPDNVNRAIIRIVSGFIGNVVTELIN